MKFKNLFGKMVAITVAATLLVGCLPTSALAQTAYTRGTFTYGAAENSGNLPDTFAYTDDYLRSRPTTATCTWPSCRYRWRPRP